MSEQRSHVPLDLKFTVSAPGKVILYGEHSVVYGKCAVASSLGLRTWLHLAEIPNKKYITIDIPVMSLLCTFELEDLKGTIENVPPIKWQNPDACEHELILAVADKFVKESIRADLNSQQVTSLTCILFLYFGLLQSVDVKPFSIKIDTDLTIGAGTGSSASFAVTTASAFLHYLRLKTDNNMTVFNKDELNIICKWAYHIEKICHGKPSGIDNNVCTYGSMVEFRKNSGVQFFTASEMELLLINTKQNRSTKQLVSKVHTFKNNHNSVFELILNAMDEVAKSALKCIMEISKSNEENLNTNYIRLSELTNINQCLLKALDVSHPKLDDICAILKTAGLSGKLTGAGGGGYAISIIPPYFNRETIQRVIEELTSKGYEAILTKLGDSGVVVH